MIIVKLCGGLGNQMFQYALGRQLSILKGTPLKLDLSWYQDMGTSTPRKYELDAFGISSIEASDDEIQAVKNSAPSLLFRLRKHILRQPIPYYKQREVYEPDTFRFWPEIFKCPRNSYLVGYWQTYKYFADIANVIRDDFSVKMPIEPTNDNLLSHIKKTEAVAIHIRRGDYASNPTTNQHHGLCSIEYYEQASYLMLKKIPAPHFFMFSDDLDWVRKNISIKAPTTYVDINTQDKGYEDLRLMTHCKHFIIANSSFSWWGAWLANFESKTIIAPKKWLSKPGASNKNMRDLLPESWLTL